MASVSLIAITAVVELLVITVVNGRNVSPDECGGVQVCTSAENVHLSCVGYCPTNQTCRWVYRLSLSEKRELSNGSTWTWMAGVNNYGVYECLTLSDNSDDNRVLQAVFIPERSSPGK